MQQEQSTVSDSEGVPSEHDESPSDPRPMVSGTDVEAPESERCKRSDADEETSGVRAPDRANDRGRFIALGVIGALAAAGVGLFALSPKLHPAVDGGAPALALNSAEVAADAGATSAPGAAESSIAIVVKPPEPPRPPPPWRVSSLKNDPAIEVAEGTFGKQGFVEALTKAGVARAEIKKLARAFEGSKRVDHPAPTDTFALARDKSKGTVVAFELATSPADVWQTRVDDSGAGEARFITKKLDLFVDHKRSGVALVLTSDLAKAISAAGLKPEAVDAIDDALEARVEAGALRSGARLRVVTTEDYVDGAFVRARVDALEMVPKSGAPIRVYYYERDVSVTGSARRAPAAGYYDAKGRQPYHGAFRSPLALARVTSRFNPKRMHPVLHTVMPHNGVDFAGATGTPVFAASAGTVLQAGNGGPCGNMVEIGHAGGLSTVYCHLNAFAQGLRAGQKVEQRQLVGYVGKTGRVTGPHLHFGVKRGGVFIDPQSLKMDGVRVLPPADRDAFQKRRQELDAVIDGVALPSAADVPDEPEDKDEVHEE